MIENNGRRVKLKAEFITVLDPKNDEKFGHHSPSNFLNLRTSHKWHHLFSLVLRQLQIPYNFMIKLVKIRYLKETKRFSYLKNKIVMN